MTMLNMQMQSRALAFLAGVAQLNVLLALALLQPTCVTADALLTSRVPVLGPDDVTQARVLKKDAKAQ